MIILHCTHKAQKRLKVPFQDDLPLTESKLGNWYCNEFTYNRSKFLLFVNEGTLLPVILSVKAAGNTEALLDIFRQRFFKILLNWEVSQNLIEHELGQVQEIVIAKTQSKSVLGSMNDFVRCTVGMCEHREIAPDSSECLAQLFRMPMGALKYKSPREATMDCLGK